MTFSLLHFHRQFSSYRTDKTSASGGFMNSQIWKFKHTSLRPCSRVNSVRCMTWWRQWICCCVSLLERCTQWAFALKRDMDRTRTIANLVHLLLYMLTRNKILKTKRKNPFWLQANVLAFAFCVVDIRISSSYNWFGIQSRSFAAANRPRSPCNAMHFVMIYLHSTHHEARDFAHLLFVTDLYPFARQEAEKRGSDDE